MLLYYVTHLEALGNEHGPKLLLEAAPLLPT